MPVKGAPVALAVALMVTGWLAAVLTATAGAVGMVACTCKV